MAEKRRIIVGITGASGVIYGIRLLESLRKTDVESHLILTAAGKTNIGLETDYRVETVEQLADVVHAADHLAAGPASGSFLTAGMAVIPCTVKSLSGIVNAYNDNLLTRAADVTLKERRRLVLVVRETPLHSGHLRLMAAAADIGAVILPPVPAFYHKPETIIDIVDQTVGKTLDCLGVEHDLFQRWGES